MKRTFTYLLLLLLLLTGSYFIHADTSVYRGPIVYTGTIVYESGGSAKLLKTGQTTQYSSELDDGYYQKGIAKSYTVLTTGQFADTVNIDLTHLVSDTGAFIGATQTYTDVGKCGVFKAAGGETIVITGSVSNNGTFTTASATANTVVVTAGFVNEADAPEITFKKREAHSNNCVLDNNTGLMWSRYVSDKMGTGGDGKMPWTGVAYDIFAYCAAANVALLGGYGDWRIGGFNACFSLITWEAPGCSIDSTAFPGDMTQNIWTSTTTPQTVANAIQFYGSSGGIAYTVKTTAGYCLLVRGG